MGYCKNIKKDCYLKEDEAFERFIGDDINKMDWKKLYFDNIIPNDSIIKYIGHGKIKLDFFSKDSLINKDIVFKYYWGKDKGLEARKKLIKVTHNNLILELILEEYFKADEYDYLKDIEVDHSIISNYNLDEILILKDIVIITNNSILTSMINSCLYYSKMSKQQFNKYNELIPDFVDSLCTFINEDIINRSNMFEFIYTQRKHFTVSEMIKIEECLFGLQNISRQFDNNYCYFSKELIYKILDKKFGKYKMLKINYWLELNELKLKCKWSHKDLI